MNMKIKGVRISDGEIVLSVNLPDILKEVPNPSLYHWSILELHGMGNLVGKSVPDFEDEINDSDEGLAISWNDLNVLAAQYRQIIDMILIGSKDKTDLKRYENDQMMYETCDFVIWMFDSSFWEVFSKDESFIDRLASKFKEVKFINSDFKNEYLKDD